MRQSAGNSAKNTLAAIRFAQRETIVVAAAGWAARIRKPVLLKTASCCPARSLGALAALTKVSIDAADVVMQRGFRHRAHQKNDGSALSKQYAFP